MQVLNLFRGLLVLMLAPLLAGLAHVRTQGAVRMSSGVDETINRFMAEANVMMQFQVPADLLRAQVLTNELGDQEGKVSRELASLVLIRVVFSIFHDLQGPVVGVHMTLRVCIPFEFSTDRRGMTAERLGDVLLRFPLPQGLPDVKSFLFP